MEDANLEGRIRGCLLGGAIGDALGAPIEFARTQPEVDALLPHDAPLEYLPTRYGPELGLVTDDTQMTLFTVEGIIRMHCRMLTKGIGPTTAVVHHALQRWYVTQNQSAPLADADGFLAKQSWLYDQRAPGDTCMNALGDGHTHKSFGMPAENDSKGCGGVMRSAPFGFLHAAGYGAEIVFELAAESAAYTHGHPTGQIASGALAVMIWHIINGESLNDALDLTIAFLGDLNGSKETRDALIHAKVLATKGSSLEHLEALGQGWIAEEALAIAVYAALCFKEAHQYEQAMRLAISHKGDSDSTGSIAGNILGALHGEECLPSRLLRDLEGRNTIIEIADDCANVLENGLTPISEIPMIMNPDGSPKLVLTPGLLDDPQWRVTYPNW